MRRRIFTVESNLVKSKIQESSIKNVYLFKADLDHLILID